MMLVLISVQSDFEDVNVAWWDKLKYQVVHSSLHDDISFCKVVLHLLSFNFNQLPPFLNHLAVLTTNSFDNTLFTGP